MADETIYRWSWNDVDEYDGSYQSKDETVGYSSVGEYEEFRGQETNCKQNNIKINRYPSKTPW